MDILLNPNDLDSYRLFLQIKQLPKYAFRGRVASFPDEYAARLGLKTANGKTSSYRPPEWMFDYQRDIACIAIKKKRFALFMDCGLGKTPIMLEFAKHAARVSKRRVLIVSPLMVVEQTMGEAAKFYGDYTIEQVRARDLQTWLNKRGRAIGITNYDAMTDDLQAGNLAGLILDESSMLKSHYGKWGTKIIELGRGLEWKLCGTGTPAPNDRIEYANHAVFLDAFPTVNSFLARFFVNRGQTMERWELKPHALDPFYRALSHWSIFLTNPATYGWKDNTANIPPINVHVHDVALTLEQSEIVNRVTGELFATSLGGITTRSQMGQLAKGRFNGQDVATNKPEFVRELVGTFGGESTIIWCIYNAEQERLEQLFPDAASIKGDTPYEDRREMIDAFKSGRIKTIISKGKVLGFGLNLQIATRQVFSGLQDSYETYYQAVKRSNRYGSTKPLNVHIPVTEVELPMVENVLRKAKMVQRDTEEQERIFRKAVA